MQKLRKFTTEIYFSRRNPLEGHPGQYPGCHENLNKFDKKKRSRGTWQLNWTWKRHTTDWNGSSLELAFLTLVSLKNGLIGLWMYNCCNLFCSGKRNSWKLFQSRQRDQTRGPYLAIYFHYLCGILGKVYTKDEDGHQSCQTEPRYPF